MYHDVANARRFVKPDIAVSHFHVRKGDKIADFGAGAGYYLRALSEAVGNDGKVYACEIRKNLVEQLTIHAREWRLPNVEPLWCDMEAEGGTKLRDELLDGGMLANALFQIERKDEALREIARVIRKGGRLFVIDWTESFAGLGPRPGDVVTPAKAKTLVESAGFAFEREFPSGEHHYGLAFRKI